MLLAGKVSGLIEIALTKHEHRVLETLQTTAVQPECVDDVGIVYHRHMCAHGCACNPDGCIPGVQGRPCCLHACCVVARDHSVCTTQCYNMKMRLKIDDTMIFTPILFVMGFKNNRNNPRRMSHQSIIGGRDQAQPIPQCHHLMYWNPYDSFASGHASKLIHTNQFSTNSKSSMPGRPRVRR